MKVTGPVGRAVAVAVAVVLAAEVGWLVVSVLRRPPRGPASSSYAAGHRGARAYATLLERGGHDVRRQRVPFDVEPAGRGDTVVVLGGADPEAAEIEALRRFVEGGGRLLVAGDESMDEWLVGVTGRRPFRRGELLACHPTVSVRETAGVELVESSGQPGWAEFGTGWLPILGCNGTTLAAIQPVGEGRVVMVSDPAVFQNYLINARDNATFALAAAGGVGRDVVFLEHVHGFDAPSGLAALPGRWQLAGALAAAGLALLVVSRRPLASVPAVPVDDHPRSLHAEAVAIRLDAGSARESAALARATATRALASAAGLGPHGDRDELRRAGSRLGLRPEDLDVTLDAGAGSGDAAAVAAAAGRVLAACAAPRSDQPRRPSRLPRPKEHDA